MGKEGFDEVKLPQKMGYDRSITMFSPDGRLLQVEYAKKTVKQGTTAIGFTCKDGILLISDKRIMDKLIVPEAVEKIFKVDEHIVATASGIISDARVLVERAQMKAQQHKVTYDTPIDIISIVKDIGNLSQVTTQSAGLRPFGVSLLVAGVDANGDIRLYQTDPTGMYFRYRATAIGEYDGEIEKILQKKYKQSITIKDALKLGVDILKKILKNNFNMERIDTAYITSKERVFKKFPKEEIKKLV